MKKTIISGLALSMALTSGSVFADSRDDVSIPSGPSLSTVYHVEEREDGYNERSFKNSSLETVLARLKAQGARLIKERLNALEANKTVIVANKSLTEAQKTALVTRITTNVNGLTALNASIASSTDATSTKALLRSVYSNFRIYGIVIPELRLEKRVYDLQNHVTTLTGTFAKVQAKIDEAKGKGKDVTVWQKSLDDAKALVATDVTTLSSLLTKVTALSPADYGTSSKATIATVNAGLKTVSKDFSSIKKNLHKPAKLADLKKDERKKTTEAGAGTPSPLFGTSWVWVSAVDNGTTTTPKNDKFVLSFGEDNHVSSKTDCNSLMGSYKLNGSLFSFGPLAMTMMFCDGSQEGVYAQLLAKVTTYTVQGNTLVLNFDKGSMTFTKK